MSAVPRFTTGSRVVIIALCTLLTMIVKFGGAQIAQNGALLPQVANRRVQVVPQCRADAIIVHIRFNPEFRSRFTDWILVGESNRPECRMRGNGELRYVVQIVLRNDPCQTKQLKPNVFENTLRFAQFPGIVLQDDLNFSFRCLRGMPDVVEFRLPQVNPTFDINRNVLSSSAQDLALLQRTPFDGRGRTLTNANLPGIMPLGRPGDVTGQSVDLGGNPQSVNLNTLAAGDNESGFGLSNPKTIANLVGSQPGVSGLDASGFAVAAGGTSSRQFDNASVNNMVAILLSLLLILFVLVFLLCLFGCLRYAQRQRRDASLMKQVAQDITAPINVAGGCAGGEAHAGAQRLLPMYGRYKSRGTGQHSSAANSPLSQNESHSLCSSSSVSNGEMRCPADEDDGPWWVGKGGPQGYLLADGQRPKAPQHHPKGHDPDSREHKYAVRAVDVPLEAERSRRPLAAAEKLEERERQAASAAFRDALHFAHAHSGELIRAPNSYAEWRERTLKRDRGSNCANLLLESEHDSGSSRKNSDESDEITVVERDTGWYAHDGAPLSPLHAPLRSITEVYHTAETRQRVHIDAVQGARTLANGQKIRKAAQPEQDHDDNIILHSSDEGEYSIPRTDENVPQKVTQKMSEEMREKLIHCADSIRGFGPRKLTEQEIARWRQLIRQDQLQQLVLAAGSLEELKALCEMPDYRLHFTRIKWSQIMECVANATLFVEATSSAKAPPISMPPPNYASATAQTGGGVVSLPKEKTILSQLNLKLNLFKGLGLPTTPSLSMPMGTSATSGGNSGPGSRVHPIEGRQLKEFTHSKSAIRTTTTGRIREDSGREQRSRSAATRQTPSVGALYVHVDNERERVVERAEGREEGGVMGRRGGAWINEAEKEEANHSTSTKLNHSRW